MLITPFHNMALMCPATTAADVDLHTRVFESAVGRAGRGGAGGVVTDRPYDLSGLRVLVTGAGAVDGIGFASARLLGRGGAHVVVTATSERVHVRRDELRAEGLDVSWGVADLSVPEQVEALVADKGPFDVLVNNAGMTSVITGSESGSLAATDPATWQASLDRNLSTAFHATRAVVPGMVSRGFGRVVMVSSVTGALVAYPGDVAYAAAKAGLVGLTRALAVELGASGVTVNAVLPGWIATGSSTQQERVMGQRTPVGRAGTASEVAAAVGFLASREASYVTGSVLVVDGGNTVQEDKG